MGIVKGISHTAFNVADLDKSLDFYCNILGFEKAFGIKIDEGLAKIIPDHPMLAYIGMEGIVYVKTPNGDYIELFRPNPQGDMTTGGPNNDDRGFVHMSFEVDDIQAAKQELIEKGVTLDSEISKGPDNTYTLWIKDPDGNRIELMQYTDESFQVVYR